MRVQTLTLVSHGTFMHSLSCTLSLIDFERTQIFTRVDESLTDSGSRLARVDIIDETSHEGQLSSTLVLVWPRLYHHSVE